jgi:long-chain acyl-CoA synthetase
MKNDEDKDFSLLADFLEHSLLTYSEKDAYCCNGQTLTFTQLEATSRQLAYWLQTQSGLAEGDRVAIQLPNINQYSVAAYAAIRAGMILVNTNPMYTAREVEHQLADSGAKAIIVLRALLPTLEQVLEKTEIQKVIVVDLEDLVREPAEIAPKQAIRLFDILSSTPLCSLAERQVAKPDDIVLIQYTGGTTGVAKGACLTHRNILNNMRQTRERLGAQCLEGQEVFVCPLPLYHIYAFTVNMMLQTSLGNLNILIPNPSDLDGFIADIQTFKFTCMSGINTLFVGLCAHAAFRNLDFSQFKLTISGGTTLTMDAANKWKKVTGCTITEGYGLSETGPVVTFNEAGKEVIGSIGKPLSETTVIILDKDGKAVPKGREGELVVKGPQVMKGYWQRPKATVEAFTSDGFFKTGDIALELESGELKIVDRLKDMILVSGFNVYPNEIEGILSEHPAVLEAAVVGKADERTGEAVWAYITVNQPVVTEEIREHCKQHLTPYKVPKNIVILDAMPKSTVGKILRKELRD